MAAANVDATSVLLKNSLEDHDPNSCAENPSTFVSPGDSNSGLHPAEPTQTPTPTQAQKPVRRRKRREVHMIDSAGANNNKNIRALRQAARTAATYDENLMDQIIQKQLGDDPSGSRGGRRKKTFDMAKEVDTETMIAYSVGFPVDSLTEEEIEAGVVSSIGGLEQTNYIVVRNHILALWRENVNVWLHRDHAMESIRSRHKSLVNSAYSFLLQHGYINFGVAAAIKGVMPPEATKANVIVIGAGLAGLAAARQMLQSGFKVVVLEGRKRPGGRVFTKKMAGCRLAAPLANPYSANPYSRVKYGDPKRDRWHTSAVEPLALHFAHWPLFLPFPLFRRSLSCLLPLAAGAFLFLSKPSKHQRSSLVACSHCGIEPSFEPVQGINPAATGSFSQALRHSFPAARLFIPIAQSIKPLLNPATRLTGWLSINRVKANWLTFL